MKNRNAFTLIEMLARPGVASKHEKRSQSRSAFTLIEMLVVIAIIALLASILVPAVNSSLARAKTLRCKTNMRGLAQAMIQYTLNTPYNQLPLNSDNSKPSGQWAWSYRLLEEGIFPEYTSVGELLRKNNLFHCPMDKGPGKDKPSFAMNNFISKGTDERYISTIPNHSNTILFAEVWGRQNNAGYTKVEPSSAFAAFERHRGSANYAFLDGHVSSLDYQRETSPDDTDWMERWDPDL